MKKTLEQRFWDKVGPHDDPTKCWLWTANTNGLAYGTFRVGDSTVLAHRLSYEMYHHVVISAGMTIDHVKDSGCVSTLCVNPHHLEMVTNKVNCLRGDGFAAKNARKGSCPQGHPYNEENTYVNAGSRHCRICNKERAENRRKSVKLHIMIGRRTEDE